MAEDGFLFIIAEGHVPQLPVPEAKLAPVGVLAQKDPAQCGFAAGHRAGDADDLPGPEGEGKTGKERGLSRIGKAEVLRLDGHRLSGRQLRQGLHRLHQGLDPPPGHLGLMNGVEQLGRLGGLARQLGKVGGNLTACNFFDFAESDGIWLRKFPPLLQGCTKNGPIFGPPGPKTGF